MQLVLMMVLAMVLWGAGWPALKIVTESVGVEVVTFWRFVIMTVAFLPILVWHRRPLNVSRKTLGIIAVSGVLSVAFMFSAFYGVAMGTAGAGGVIITILSPVITVLFSIWILKTRVTSRQWQGLLLGLFGGMLMIELWNFDALQSGNLFFVGSALVWSAITLLSQKAQLHLHPLHYSFLLALCSMVVMIPIGLSHELSMVFEQDARFWVALLYLGIFGQTVASTIFFIASGKLGSGAASSYMFLVPFSALVFSYGILDEVPSFWLVVGGVVSSAAIYMMHRPKTESPA